MSMAVDTSLPTIQVHNQYLVKPPVLGVHLGTPFMDKPETVKKTWSKGSCKTAARFAWGNWGDFCRQFNDTQSVMDLRLWLVVRLVVNWNLANTAKGVLVERIDGLKWLLIDWLILMVERASNTQPLTINDYQWFNGLCLIVNRVHGY